jgi:translation initiation factor 1A
MPKGCKKQKNHVPVKEQRSLIKKDDSTNYGIVTKKLGSGRFKIRLNLENKELIGRLRGKFKHGSQKKKNWVEEGTVVLVGIRDFQDDMVDIIHVYDQAEVRILRKENELVEEANREEDETDVVEEETPFDFEEL